MFQISFQCILYTQSCSEEAASTRKLLDLIRRKTNRDFDQFCEALHENKQTHIVQHLLVTKGINLSLLYLIYLHIVNVSLSKLYI